MSFDAETMWAGFVLFVALWLVGMGLWVFAAI
jgi:hypothetical protein